MGRLAQARSALEHRQGPLLLIPFLRGNLPIMSPGYLDSSSPAQGP